MNDRSLDPPTLVARALELGASLAGVASVADLRKAPSFLLADSGWEIPGGRGGRPGDAAPAGRPARLPQVAWPERAASVLVVAVAHPADEPSMDWWSGREGPPGNRLLAHIVARLCAWVETTHGVEAIHLPYHVENGGLFLKDAAVLAGLGVIGRNNLLVTFRYGPRVRLRALALSADLSSTGRPDFDPCAACPAPCHTACPQTAFTPGREDPTPLAAAGGFSRPACFRQMDADVAAAGDVIRYCRACELGCLAGEDTT